MEYLTVDGEATATYEIQRSVFICSVKGIETYEEGVAYYKAVAKKYSDATHNCYAIVCRDEQQKFFDDGEPQGTAGMPILQVLKKSNLSNVVAVVTRYFGGIKLGAGGLVASYTKSCADAIAVAETAKVILCDRISIRAPYSDYKKIADVVKTQGIIDSTEFSDEVTINCSVPVENTEPLLESLNELTAGKLCHKKTIQAFVKFRKPFGGKNESYFDKT